MDAIKVYSDLLSRLGVKDQSKPPVEGVSADSAVIGFQRLFPPVALVRCENGHGVVAGIVTRPGYNNGKPMLLLMANGEGGQHDTTILMDVEQLGDLIEGLINVEASYEDYQIANEFQRRFGKGAK